MCIKARFKSILFILLYLSAYCQAAEDPQKKVYMQGALAFSNPDAGSQSDLKSNVTGFFIGGIELNQYISPELGFYTFSTEQKSTEYDAVSQYRIAIDSRDFLIGLKAQYPLASRVKWYLRGGALIWDTEFELREDFWNIIPGGSVSQSDDGVGYYLHTGLNLFASDLLYMNLFIGRNQRNNIFEETSDYPIDLAESIAGFGFGFSF